ncbi:MAG: ribosomal-processing cysteine protease Prp [Clostridia bacterium]
MITIRVEFQDGETRRLAVDGHAGQANPGEDIVCAGVSALVETLRLGLQQVVPGQASYEVDPGHAEFRFEPGAGREQRAVVDTILAGLRDLAGSYSRFVTFEAGSR